MLQVGSDIFGRDIISNFERWGVDTQFITKKSVDTGVAQINVTDNGKQLNVYYMNIRIL